ncbi:MBL fold metallo-hydrolase [Sphingopyxis sp. MWB1]|uniref:MBL fold metallo-hydrolase n=1 Tax=Sphingopyxis sp. MWB1 TaxID=1537715 RepID=UPI00068D8D9C|nr:MBL fold metallo-hydrolase [Sphingopyxis sp. MWB1]
MMLRSLFLAVTLCSAAPAIAQNNWKEVAIESEILAPGIAMISGAGGNVAVHYGTDGTLMVDSQFAPLAARLMAATERLGADPAKWLVNTHWHADHTGGNESFAMNGAVIIAQEKVRQRLGAGQMHRGKQVLPRPDEALPRITYSDAMTLRFNDDDLHIIHAPNAHTDGDSILHWERANVLHMGDIFFHKTTLPFIDLESGGSARGLLAAVEKALERADEGSRIIPGHGPLATRADLTAYRDMLAKVIGAVEEAKAAGRSLAEIQADNPAAPYEVADGFISADAFVAAIYNSSADERAPADAAEEAEQVEEEAAENGASAA